MQPGQPVVIRAGSELYPVTLDVAPFVQALARQAYVAGASYVHVLWFDPEVARLNLQHAAPEQLTTYPAWQAGALMQLVEQGAAFITLLCPDPETFQGLDPRRMTARAQAQALALRPIQQAIGTFTVRWLVASLPTKPWARLVFSDLPPEAAVARLWDLICQATRVNAADPIAAWQEHLAQLGRRQDWLARARLRSLHYTAPGTDLYVDLLPVSRWVSGASAGRDGIACVPNMPTEEVFTTPRRGGTHGIVRCTFPLYHNGILIENITLRFDEGRIVEATASQGLEVLTGVLDTDEGARYLGEVALVPADSTVANLRTVFCNTLFDENASCHLAFGQGLELGIAGGQGMTADHLAAQGVNQSAVHVDVMIGSEQLDIDGETDSGQTIALLRQGRWASPTL